MLSHSSPGHLMPRHCNVLYMWATLEELLCSVQHEKKAFGSSTTDVECGGVLGPPHSTSLGPLEWPILVASLLLRAIQSISYHL